MLDAKIPETAVLFAGLLGVGIPERGATARRFLVDVLGADVLVAGTRLPSESPDVLWARVSGLEPIAARVEAYDRQPSRPR